MARADYANLLEEKNSAKLGVARATSTGKAPKIV